MVTDHRHRGVPASPRCPRPTRGRRRPCISRMIGAGDCVLIAHRRRTVTLRQPSPVWWCPGRAGSEYSRSVLIAVIHLDRHIVGPLSARIADNFPRLPARWGCSVTTSDNRAEVLSGRTVRMILGQARPWVDECLGEEKDSESTLLGLPRGMRLFGRRPQPAVGRAGRLETAARDLRCPAGRPSRPERPEGGRGNWSAALPFYRPGPRSRTRRFLPATPGSSRKRRKLFGYQPDGVLRPVSSFGPVVVNTANTAGQLRWWSSADTLASSPASSAWRESGEQESHRTTGSLRPLVGAGNLGAATDQLGKQFRPWTRPKRRSSPARGPDPGAGSFSSDFAKVREQLPARSLTAVGSESRTPVASSTCDDGRPSTAAISASSSLRRRL